MSWEVFAQGYLKVVKQWRNGESCCFLPFLFTHHVSFSYLGLQMLELSHCALDVKM